jgi:hypothetical protein
MTEATNEAIESTNTDADDEEELDPLTHLQIWADEAADAQRTQDALLGKVFTDDAADANGLPKLSRYEAALNRRRNEALRELTAMQLARHTAQAADHSDTPPTW